MSENPTKVTPELLPSEGAREAAADLITSAAVTDVVLQGAFDGHDYVQAFARFERDILARITPTAGGELVAQTDAGREARAQSAWTAANDAYAQHMGLPEESDHDAGTAAAVAVIAAALSPTPAAPDAAFLRDLAGRLFRFATPAQGFDQSDVDQLHRIARLSTPSPATSGLLQEARDALANCLPKNVALNNHHWTDDTNLRCVLRLGDLREIAALIERIDATPAVAPAASADEGLVEMRPMEAWADYEHRDKMVLLLVEFEDHPTDDAAFALTIGANNDHNVFPDEAQGWQFAGWCWSHDHFTDGIGKPVGWLPLPHHFAQEREVALRPASDKVAPADGGEGA